MSDVRAGWNRMEARFRALNPKERLLVSFACAAVAFLAFEVTLIAPALSRARQASQQIGQKRMEADKLAPMVKELTARQSVDPDRDGRQRLAELQGQSQRLQQALQAQSAQMVPADEMSRLLERLLANHPRLELAALKTLPAAVIEMPREAKPAKAGAAAEPTGTASGIYRYGLELSIRGNYLDVLAYLREVEALPGRIYWDRFELSVTDFPVSTVRLTLYTLSFDRAWLTL